MEVLGFGLRITLASSERFVTTCSAWLDHVQRVCVDPSKHKFHAMLVCINTTLRPSSSQKQQKRPEAPSRKAGDSQSRRKVLSLAKES